MILIAQLSGQHIAHKQGINLRRIGIIHGRFNGIPGKMANRGIPMLADVSFSNSNNRNVIHSYQIRAQWSFVRSRQLSSVQTDYDYGLGLGTFYDILSLSRKRV